MSHELVTLGVHCDKWNNEMTSQQTELQSSRVIPVVKTDFVELIQGHMAEKDASFVSERIEFEAKLAEA